MKAKAATGAGPPNSVDELDVQLGRRDGVLDEVSAHVASRRVQLAPEKLLGQAIPSVRQAPGVLCGAVELPIRKSAKERRAEVAHGGALSKSVFESSLSPFTRQPQQPSLAEPLTHPAEKEPMNLGCREDPSRSHMPDDRPVSLHQESHAFWFGLFHGSLDGF
jgi:hypothetical protein